MKTLRVFLQFSLAALLILPFTARGQSDNFDSYSSAADLMAAGWKLSALSPALVTTTFPPTATGKGMRLQANPVPDTAPAVGMWYRTNLYTDFYVAIDIADWPGTDKNQAAVLFARVTDAETGALPSNLNPAAAQGYICNYDTAQYGENPTDRRQGQFQINIIGPGFDANTLAAADVTFIPGRSYRMVFHGVGSSFTAEAYDMNDLTSPLVVLHADDATYSEGGCGFLGFSREGNTGTVDMTVDNYYAGAIDPNPAPDLGVGPALAHPVPGTPAVSQRAIGECGCIDDVLTRPLERWKSFVSPSDKIEFTADTWNGNVINASATRLLLNGEDLSSHLNLSPNGPEITGSLGPGVLQSNTVYAGEIIVTDLAGQKSSTNTFWFDTFSRSYLTNSPVKTVEAEDYNYGSGQFLPDPIPVSGLNSSGALVNGGGVGYYDLPGTPEIDYHDSGTQVGSGLSADYRTADYVGTQQGESEVEDASGTPLLNDILQRPQYTAVDVPEYEVRRFDPGEWMNYTRVFAPTNYTVYLRAGSLGATTVELDSVTSDPTQENQTTNALGTFAVPNTFLRSNFRYVPLVDSAGKPVVLSLSGTNTLRLTNIGTDGQDARKANLNYLLFVPAGAPAATVLESASVVSGPYSEAIGAVVDLAGKTVTVPISGQTGFYRIRSSTALRITGIRISGQNAVITYQ